MITLILLYRCTFKITKPSCLLLFSCSIGANQMQKNTGKIPEYFTIKDLY